MNKFQGLWGMMAVVAALAIVATGCFESPQKPAADSAGVAAPTSQPAAAGAEHPAGDDHSAAGAEHPADGDHPAAMAADDTGAAPASQPAASEHPEHPGE